MEMNNSDTGSRLVGFMKLFHVIYAACRRDPLFYEAVYVMACTMRDISLKGWSDLGIKANRRELERQAVDAWGFRNGLPIGGSKFTSGAQQAPAQPEEEKGG